MARVDLSAEFLIGQSPLADRISAGRRGKVLKLYKALLHSPPVAETWFEHMNAVRWKTELSGRLRELVIIRIAYLSRADYVLRQHVPVLAAADNVTPAECDALACWEESGHFTPMERAILAYTDAMTRDIDVAAPIFDAARAHVSERQMVELTVLIGTYNMHVRVLKALAIEPE